MANDRLQNLLTQLQPKKQNLLGTLGQAAQAAGMGMLGQQYTPPKQSGSQDLLAKLLIQKQIDEMLPSASERKAQIELANIENRQAGQTPGGLPTTITDTQPVSPVSSSEQKGTPQFIQIQDGLDKFGLPKFKTVKNPEFERLEKVDQQILKSQGEQLKKSIGSNVNFKRTASMFKNIIAQVKGSAEEKGGLGLKEGLRGKVGVAIKDPKFSRTASAFGQRVETALTLNSILTGQNRVIRGVVDMILKSLPEDLDPGTTVASKVAQSLKNSYSLVKSFEQAGLTPEKLKGLSQEELDTINPQSLEGFDLSTEEEAEIEAIIQEVLNTPAAKRRALPGIGQPIGGKIDVKTLSDEELQKLAGV